MARYLLVILLFVYSLQAEDKKIYKGRLIGSGTILRNSSASINIRKNDLAEELSELSGQSIRVLCRMIENDCFPLKYEISPFLTQHKLRPWTLKRIPKYVFAEHFAFNPKVTPDGNVLFWTAYVKTTTYATQKIWASVKDEDGFWGKGFQMDAPLNNNQPSAVISALPGGNELFIFGSFGDQEKLKEIDIEYNRKIIELSNQIKDTAQYNRKKALYDDYYSRKRQAVLSRVPLYKSHKIEGGGWSNPEAIKFPTFYNQYRRPEKPDQEVFGGSTLSSSGKILIYSSQQINTKGKLDLYVSIADENNLYPLGTNLGDLINTEEEEMAPFLASDDKTLYFSRTGSAGTDIYMTRRIGSSWTRWTKPISISDNLKGVNFFSIPVNEKWAYISKNNGHLMMAYLPGRFQPDPVILVSGIVKGEDGKPLSSDITIESLTKKKKNGSTVSDPATGKFSLVLPYGERYGFFAQKKGYLPVSKNIDLRNLDKKFNEIAVEIILPLVKVSSQITINNLFFKTGKFDITPESEPELDRLAKVIIENPEIKVQIEGHTDDVGKKENNMELSYKRANSVVDYLINKHKISKDRLVVKGFGETKPVVKNTSAENRQKNRRVVFKILD